MSILQKQNIDNKILKEAFSATVKKRGTEHFAANYKEIIEIVAGSAAMNNQWARYQREFDYAKDIRFVETCKAANQLMEDITTLQCSIEQPASQNTPITATN